MSRMHLKMVIRNRVGELLDDLVESLVDRAEASISNALAVARSSVESEIGAAVYPSDVPAEEPEDGQPEDTSPPGVLEMEPAPARKRSKMRCGKCGELGFRADGCGSTHNIPTDDPDDDAPPASSAAVESKRDRFSEIEASAKKRRGELPTPRSTFTT